MTHKCTPVIKFSMILSLAFHDLSSFPPLVKRKIEVLLVVQYHNWDQKIMCLQWTYKNIICSLEFLYCPKNQHSKSYNSIPWQSPKMQRLNNWSGKHPFHSATSFVIWTDEERSLISIPIFSAKMNNRIQSFYPFWKFNAACIYEVVLYRVR